MASNNETRRIPMKRFFAIGLSQGGEIVEDANEVKFEVKILSSGKKK